MRAVRYVKLNGLPRASGKGFPKYVRRGMAPREKKSAYKCTRKVGAFSVKQGGTAGYYPVPAIIIAGTGFFLSRKRKDEGKWQTRLSPTKSILKN
ncbi:MAG: hypothetical protein II387_06490, partial [Oscillospiraceae bacterium]|nr:hypothetical protein [Oscillospiraceae bacterium]